MLSHSDPSRVARGGAMRFRGVGAAVRAMRPRQWAKNGLVAVPLLLTPSLLTESASQLVVALAMLAFCAAASAGYLLNDLLDLDADRVHPVKRARPMAARVLSRRVGTCMAVGLTCVALAFASLVGERLFVVSVALYLAITSVYSLGLKRLLVVDVLLLAVLYTLRIIGGAAAIAIKPTPWLILISLWVFVSLAFAKRCSELEFMRSCGQESAPGRAYRVRDIGLVTTLGVASGCVSGLVLCLGIGMDTLSGVYPRGLRLWLLAPVGLYWISRIWFLARRGELSGDPLAFAARDPVSWASGILAVILLAIGAR